MWQGKVLGGVIGVFAGGPAGALIGAFVGHLLDMQNEQKVEQGRVDPHSVQESFFRATFQLMGHVAKADGRVSEDEIRAARAVMAEFRLGENEIRYAIELFTAGKAPDFPVQETLQHMARVCARRADLRRMFIQIQLQVALWGGSLNPHGRVALKRICAALGVSEFELAQMEALLRMQQGAARPQQAPVDPLPEAYEVLGVSKDASDSEVTKAYRRLMSRNHPDKLVAKGLPESMMKVAEEKTRRVLAAYEVVRAARGMK